MTLCTANINKKTFIVIVSSDKNFLWQMYIRLIIKNQWWKTKSITKKRNQWERKIGKLYFSFEKTLQNAKKDQHNVTHCNSTLVIIIILRHFELLFPAWVFSALSRPQKTDDRSLKFNVINTASPRTRFKRQNSLISNYQAI